MEVVKVPAIWEWGSCSDFKPCIYIPAVLVVLLPHDHSNIIGVRKQPVTFLAPNRSLGTLRCRVDHE